MLDNYGDLLTPTEAATVLRLRPQTLAWRRLRGLPPRFVKETRRVLYRKQDLIEHLQRGLRSSTADPGAAEK